MANIIYIETPRGSLSIDADSMGNVEVTADAHARGWGWIERGTVKRFHGGASGDYYTSLFNVAYQAAKVADLHGAERWAVAIATQARDTLWQLLANSVAAGVVPANLARSSATESVNAALGYLAANIAA